MTWKDTTIGPFRGDYADGTQEWAKADYLNMLEKLAELAREAAMRLNDEGGYDPFYSARIGGSGDHLYAELIPWAVEDWLKRFNEATK